MRLYEWRFKPERPFYVTLYLFGVLPIWDMDAHDWREAQRRVDRKQGGENG